eukprot:scaffold264985_cov21-Tisochrysis_lutea.AAC.1
MGSDLLFYKSMHAHNDFVVRRQRCTYFMAALHLSVGTQAALNSLMACNIIISWHAGSTALLWWYAGSTEKSHGISSQQEISWHALQSHGVQAALQDIQGYNPFPFEYSRYFCMLISSIHTPNSCAGSPPGHPEAALQDIQRYKPEQDECDWPASHIPGAPRCTWLTWSYALPAAQVTHRQTCFIAAEG